MIFDALERVVAQHGLGGASMAAIAAAAGMSKRTLYAVHDSRDALLAAWVRRLRASMVRPLPPEARGLPLPQRLRLLLMPETMPEIADARLVALRAVIAEAPRNPDLARTFLREGPQAARALVHAELARAAAAGEVVLADTALTARLLCDMAWPCPIDRLIDPDADTDAGRHRAAVAARLDLAIAVFLHGVGPTADRAAERPAERP
jgi:AcrR family transcriptional regulator